MIYVFKHPKKDEFIEIEMPIHAKHEYTDKKGIKWERIFTCPQMSIDTKSDPFSERDYINKTASKKGSVGDLLDRSAELSEKRAAICGGEDPVKRKHFDQYSKTRRNIRHPNDPKRYEKLKKMGVTFEK